MPRRGRGGHRQGTPGATYTNRTDLNQSVRTAPSRRYGEAAASARAQEVLPLPQTPAPGGGPTAAAGMPAPVGPLPGDQPLARPSDRPNEPLTAGMAMGPGPGPSAAMSAVDPVVETLRSAYRAFPNEAVAALLERLEGQ